MVMPYHLHMPSYFLETFTEYPYIQQVHQTVMGVDVECGLSLPAWKTIPFVFPHPSHKHLVFMRKEPVQSECHDNLNFCHTSC